MERGRSNVRKRRKALRWRAVVWAKRLWALLVLPLLVLLGLIQLSSSGGDSWPARIAPPILVGAHQKVAICLSGAARTFELTGPSIKEHLLSAYPDADVFLVVPFDKNTHKLSLLAGVGNVVRAYVTTQSLLLEDDISKELFDEYGSPEGVQGLLQYFELIETCRHAILDHEKENRMRYSWILRTRPDSFWNAPPPPLSSFKPRVYTAPHGVDFDGVNDRLSIASRSVALKMLSRSSSKKELWAAGLRSANSEIALKAQLRLRKVQLERLDFPFCVITRRTFPFVDRPEEVPVVPIGSAVTLNGVYCKPCSPMLVGKAAFDKMGSYRKSLRWFGDPREGAEICNSTAEWEGDWERAFDAKVSPNLVNQRFLPQNETLEECKQRVGAFLHQVPLWRGPSVRDLCLFGFLGKPRQVMKVKMYLTLLRGPSHVTSKAIALSRSSRVGVALASASSYTSSQAMSPPSANFCPVHRRCRYPDVSESARMIDGLPRRVYVGLLEVPGLTFASHLLRALKATPDLWVCQLVLTYAETEADVKAWGDVKVHFESLGYWLAHCGWTSRKEARCLLFSNRHCNIKLI